MTATGALLARPDRLPLWPYPRRLLWVVGVGYFFAFFDAVNVGFALPVIDRQFDISQADASFIVTGGLGGYVVGAVLGSRLADARGRHVALQISVATLAAGSTLAAI